MNVGKRWKRGKRQHVVMDVGKNYEFIYIYQKTSGIHTNLQNNMSTFVNAGRFQSKAKI